MKRFAARLTIATIVSFSGNCLAALSVTSPPAGAVVVSAGGDYATQVVGDPFDMSQTTDVDFGESAGFSAQSIASGVYSATVANPTVAASFYPLFQGWSTQSIPHWMGELHPIDNSKYRYFTIKASQSDVASLSTDLLFLQDGDSYGTGTFGHTTFLYLPQQTTNHWTINSWDLQTDTFGGAYHSWPSLSQVRGLRFDFNGGGAVQVDWVRLTAPGTAANSYTVTWSDSSPATYNILAIDGVDGTTFKLNPTPVSGTSYVADFSRLAPGDYQIEVDNLGNSTTARSPGIVRINTPPQVSVTAPSIRGEQAESYAVAANGHQWASFTSDADFFLVSNFTNKSYNNPSGSFYGRPTNGDPGWTLDSSNALIDADYYRSACFTEEVFGTRDVQNGSVARLFWGPGGGSMTTTKDIVLYNNTVPNEYCVEDLSAVPLEPGPPSVQWGGSQIHFRLDPSEVAGPQPCTSTAQACHDVRLDSVYLSPFAHASPAYTIKWNLTDSSTIGSGASTTLLLNTARSDDLSHSVTLATLAYSAGAQQYRFVTQHAIPNGTYYVGIQANDGYNTVLQYAGGPIVVDSTDVIFNNGFDR